MEQEPAFWIRKCLDRYVPSLLYQRNVSGGSGCSVWDCALRLDGKTVRVILKLFHSEFVNGSGLGPVDSATKCALALTEFTPWGVPTPKLVGFAQQGHGAAVLYEKIAGERWDSTTRSEAARILARLHRISVDQFSPELRELVRRSAPNRLRVLHGLLAFASDLDTSYPRWRQEHPQLCDTVQELVESGEPASGRSTLVHGDFFSANLMLDGNGLHVIDWDLLACGDPMWDLGFLIGADSDVPDTVVNAVVDAYREGCPVDFDVLEWHKNCWDSFWALRHLLKQVEP